MCRHGWPLINENREIMPKIKGLGTAATRDKFPKELIAGEAGEGGDGEFEGKG